jgi:hypothetical protein
VKVNVQFKATTTMEYAEEERQNQEVYPLQVFNENILIISSCIVLGHKSYLGIHDM